MSILVTGSAGFIGFHLSLRLLQLNYKVIGLDNLDNYYDVKLKKKRILELKKFKKFKFIKIDIRKKNQFKYVNKYKITSVFHLAAQAGVRYSFYNPRKYIETNIQGFFNLLEFMKIKKIKNLIFASTSSVYGNNKKFPLVENLKNLKPTSLYGSTKLFNEEMARIASIQNGIKCVGVRFFTVYGPFGRPDMSLFLFTKNILNKKKIDVFNRGKHERDFTYVDDVINALLLIFRNLKKEKNFNIYNIASGRPVKLMNFIKEIEKNLALKAKIKFKKLQRGDIVKTHANIKKIKNLGYKSKTNYKLGVSKFVEWYKKNKN
jgi:UDP-glucuronate 4-epimerase